MYDMEGTNMINKVGISQTIESFILCREAMGVSDKTIRFYQFNLGKFNQFMLAQGIDDVAGIKPYHIRTFLAEMKERGSSDNYRHGNARCIKTFLRFCLEDGHIQEFPKFEMPKIAKQQLTTLTIDQVNAVIKECKTIRDKTLLMFAVDSGLRLSEIIALNWSDIDLKTGIVKVLHGKGNKFRIVPIGSSVRRMLVKYKSELDDIDNDSPVFQTDDHRRFAEMGLRSVFVRLSEKSSVQFSCHALRRTFAKLSVKSGKDILYIQNSMGHENVETTRHYIQLLDEEDIRKDHKKHGVIDNLFRL